MWETEARSQKSPEVTHPAQSEPGLGPRRRWMPRGAHLTPHWPWGRQTGGLLPLSSCEGSWWKRGSGALGKEGRIPAPTVGARGMQGPGAGAGRQGRGPETRWAPTLIGQVSKPGAERRVSRPRSACQAGPGLLGEQEKGQTGAALGTAWRPGGPGVIHRGGSSWGSGASGPLLPLQTWLLCPRRSGRTQPVPSVLRPLPCLS